jgi:hypothetical protein
LHNIQSKKKLAGEKSWETHFFSNKDRDEWIKDCLQRQTAVATMQVHDAERAMMQEQGHQGNDEKGLSTTTTPEITFQELLTAIRDSLSDLSSSEDDEDGEDEDDDEEDTAHGKLGEHDEPGWVLGTISKTEQRHMESFRQKQIKIDKLMQPGEGDAADCIRQSEMKYGMTELKVLAVGKPQTDTTAATPSPTMFGALMQAL